MKQKKTRRTTPRQRSNSNGNGNGLRATSFHLPGIGRVTVNLDSKERQALVTAASDKSRYSPAELNGLRTAAAIIAAKDAFQPDSDPEQIFRAMLQIAPDHMIRSADKCFLPLAAIALQLVSDVCMWRGIAKVAGSVGAPPVYNMETVDKLIDQFKVAVKSCLGTPLTGRPVETTERLLKIGKALRDLDAEREKPTQDRVAEKLDIKDTRILRDWPKSCDLSWREYLRAARFLSAWSLAEEN